MKQILTIPETFLGIGYTKDRAAVWYLDFTASAL
jgi:hypothetical protein